MMRLEEATERFRKLMLERLGANRHKQGWENMTPDECFYRILQEAAELFEAMRSGGHSQMRREAADIANFAMFLSENTPK